MAESFEKLKKKTLFAAIVKSAVIGVSAGLFIVGIILLALVLGKIYIHWGFYLLIGVLVAAISGGVSFLIMHPTDIKVAKKYDKEYKLNEKLQTMVAFSGQESDILTLQREDAAQALAAVPEQKIQFKRIWQYCVIAVLALAMFFSAVFIPAAAQEGEFPPDDVTDNPPPDGENPEEKDVFEYDLYMQSAMGELISNVRESSLAKSEKDSIIAVLETLDANLSGIDTNSGMHTAVISAVAVIDGIIYEANTFRPISGAVEKFDANLADGIRKGIAVYNSSNSPLTDISRVKALEARLGDLIDIAFEEPFEKSVACLKIPQSELLEDGSKKLEKVMTEYVDALTAYLSEADENDSVIAALDTFRKSLKTTKDKIAKNYKDETLFSEIDGAYKALNTNMNAALNPQCYNCVMNLFIRERLAAIFGIQSGELPSFNDDIITEEGNENGDTNGDKDGDGNTNGNGGGNGKYEFVFGSDDIIYDPDRADYVSYGEVLDAYYAKVQNKIIAGEIPEDLAKILQNYFEILYNGIKDETVEE